MEEYMRLRAGRARSPYRAMEDCMGDSRKDGQAACMPPLQRKR